jgi:hypothetical protein
MGLLDDAIREHLDLKRRRGADPAEIERAEREALGPVRRSPEEMEHDVDAPDFETAGLHDEAAPGGEPLDYGTNGEEAWGESFDDETELFGEERPPAFGHVPPAAETEHAEAPLPEDEFATRRREVTPVPFDAEEHAPPAPAEPPAAAPPSVSPDAHQGEETAEYDVEQEMDKQADDVLEETPEFLQDTPDHDRLWFEQRPPRDFDFDG